jgi:hypothetical protein
MKETKLDQPRLMLQPAWKQIWLYAAGFVVLFVIGVLMIPELPVVGAINVGFSVIGITVMLWSVLSSGASLRLDGEGFSYATMFRRYSFKWQEVDHFGVIKIGLTEVVGYTLSAAAKRTDGNIQNKHSIGFDGFMPSAYGRSPAELAELMEKWRSENLHEQDGR